LLGRPSERPSGPGLQVDGVLGGEDKSRGGPAGLAVGAPARGAAAQGPSALPVAPCVCSGPRRSVKPHTSMRRRARAEGHHTVNDPDRSRRGARARTITPGVEPP
jgi:hypothetical protein